MATRPDKLEIRSYNVGFGDCFLLTFSYAQGRARNVLIDFGSTKLAGATPTGGLVAVAKLIRDQCDGKLDMVVATHRHADHISGFGGESGKIIRDLKPDLVVQPWTEDPKLAPDARAPAGRRGGAALGARSHVASLSEMHAVADAARSRTLQARLAASPAVPKALADQIHFLGETNIKNEAAVRNLMTMGAKARYASFGDRLPTAALLPGVGIEVLGPPTLAQAPAIARQAAVDAEEFWHIAARRARSARDAKPTPVFPRAPVARTVPQEARWVIPRIDKMRAEEMLAILRSMDGVLNNTSLILLFEIDKRLFLFPGDAQLENWSYALHGAPDAAKIRRRLARASFYKVGHHGSLNATPKTLWNAFQRRGPKPVAGRLETMVSTAAKVHGSLARGTEVPRRPLIEALDTQSNLHNTQALRSKKQPYNLVTFEF